MQSWSDIDTPLCPRVLHEVLLSSTMLVHARAVEGETGEGETTLHFMRLKCFGIMGFLRLRFSLYEPLIATFYDHTDEDKCSTCWDCGSGGGSTILFKAENGS